MQHKQQTEALLMSYGDNEPKIGKNAWIAPGSTVIGDIEIGETIL